MSQPNGREVLGFENRQKLIAVRIAIGAAGAPSIAQGAKTGIKVAKSATGTIAVTLPRAYKRVFYRSAKVELGSAETTTIGDQVNVDTSAVSTTGVVTLFTSTTVGTLADLASGREIALLLLLSDSDV